jgi:hypothetical protein
MAKHLLKWLPSYLKECGKNVLVNNSGDNLDGLKHIIFLFVDHFELAGKTPRLEEWLKRYPALASTHRDADGCKPRHTWFYAMDLMREYELVELKKMVELGLGEVELHWHHSHDNIESFQQKLHDGLSVFQKHGFMQPVGNGKLGSFAFIHGNWSLGNSLGAGFCGVDNEIELLLQAGCYADFTFPALFSKAQPTMINSIYYAGNNKRPKGYDRGKPAKVGLKPNDDELMIFQGPLNINWHDWRYKWHPLIENGEIGRTLSHYDPVRIDNWVNQRICVLGRPEWIFVKVFCHGGQDYESVLGDSTHQMFSYLESMYNDGIQYQLHYVTAREAYNIVKAAEDGQTGTPNTYRDYVFPPPLQ